VRHLVLILAVLAACEEDKPDTAELKRAKEECKALLKHIVSISPQAAGKDPDEIVAALPIEDIQACMATDPEVRKCMGEARDVATIADCPGRIACAGVADKARDKARKAANQPTGSATIDKPFDDIRAKCLAGDAHAADALKAAE
jgi:hypothetical protein